MIPPEVLSSKVRAVELTPWMSSYCLSLPPVRADTLPRLFASTDDLSCATLQPRMPKFLTRMFRSTEAQDLIEYALLAAALSIIALIVLSGISGNLGTTYRKVDSALAAGNTSSSPGGAGPGSGGGPGDPAGAGGSGGSGSGSAGGSGGADAGGSGGGNGTGGSTGDAGTGGTDHPGGKVDGNSGTGKSAP